MKTILATAYDINPYKGSESGTGWNFVYQISRFNKVIAITRKNNKENIDRYIIQHKINTSQLIFYYYDLPYWMRFWKRGVRGSSIYFYLWQMFIPLYIIKQKLQFDIAHNINFHSDCFPTFLWILCKPTVWGPINHNEKIPTAYCRQPSLLLKEEIKWCIKKIIWLVDPFLKVAKKNSTIILVGNNSCITRLNLQKNYTIFNQVASASTGLTSKPNSSNFHIIMVGRFIPIKGFDIALKAFGKFIKNLSTQTTPYNSKDIIMSVIGKGPQKKLLLKIVEDLNIQDNVTFINWVSKEELNKLYIKGSLLFFPSHEGAGMVIAEALSFGLPILCFNNFGPGELVDDTCAIRINYSNYKKSLTDFSEALLLVYQNKALYEALCKGALIKFNNEYDWNIKGRQLKNIYNKILS